jgi:hypothetical protein
MNPDYQLNIFHTKALTSDAKALYRNAKEKRWHGYSHATFMPPFLALSAISTNLY